MGQETREQKALTPIHNMGPWRSQLVSIFTVSGEGPLFTAMGSTVELSKALIERAVLCLNICQGIPNEDLSRSRIQRRLRADELMDDDLVALMHFEIITQHGMWTRHQTKKLAYKNKRVPLQKAIRAGEILELHVGKIFMYPIFQFPDDQLSVIAASVNLILEAKDNPWRAAMWWFAPHNELAGVKPCDLVGTEDESKLVSLAKQFAGDVEEPETDAPVVDEVDDDTEGE